MVTRRLLLVSALLMAGCPDSIHSGRGGGAVVVDGLVAPESLSGTPNGGSEILLTWADRATTETGYRLDVNHSPFDTPVIADLQLLDANATSFVYPSFPNTTYYFRVVAVTAAKESDPSNVLVVTTPNVPARPEGVRARPHSSSGIQVTWQDVSGETGYVIERSSDGGATWTGVGAASADTTSYVSTGMAPNSEHAHRVVAVGMDGRSTPSKAATSTTTTDAVSIWGTITGDNGRFTSVAIAPDGLEHIAHYDDPSGNLMETRRVVGSGSVSLETAIVDGAPPGNHDVGGDGTGIGIDASGKVHVVAHDRTSDTLRYVTNASGSWVATQLDGPGSGIQPQIVCDRSTGDLHVLHRESAPDPNAFVPDAYMTRYLHRVPGRAWEPARRIFYTLPTVRFALGLSPANVPHILSVTPLRELQVSFGLPTGSTGPGGVPGMIWSSYPAIPLPSTPSLIDDVAMAISDQGRIHVVFHDAGTRSLHHAESAGPVWTVEVVEGSAELDLGTHCAVAVQPGSARVHVVYHDATNKDLRYARKDVGGPWVRRVIDAAADVGTHASIAVSAAGVVYIAYRDETAHALRLAVGSP